MQTLKQINLTQKGLTILIIKFKFRSEISLGKQRQNKQRTNFIYVLNFIWSDIYT